MTLDEVPSGENVLVDANILVYNALGSSQSCHRLLRRGERRDIRLWISAATFAEARHALMISEARDRKLIAGGSPAQKLAERPDIVQQLCAYLDYEKQIRGAVSILDLTEEIIGLGARVSRETGLLTNDSLLIATLRQHGWVNLASADKALENVASIRLFQPADVGSFH